MKKTLLSIILSFIWIFGLVTGVSAASGNLTAVATPTKDGTSFTVDLLVNNNPGFIAVTASVSYDDTVLKLTSADNGEIFDSIFMPSQYLTVNPYKIIWMEATASENIKTNGVLAKYTFEVLDSAALGETEIKFNIDEVVNYEKDNSTSFKGCTFKINVDGTLEDNKTDNEIPVSSNTQNTSSDTPLQNTADNTLIVKKPLPTDSSITESGYYEPDTEETIDMEDSEDLTNGVEIDMTDTEEVTSKTEEPKNPTTDRTKITIITVAAILIAGILITLIALYFRKKSKNTNNQE